MTWFVLAALVVAALLAAPVLAPYPPSQIDYGAVLAAPGAHHLLGTDDLGRDVLSRLLYGGGETVLTAGAAVALAVVVGVAFGAVAGSAGPLVDRLVMVPVDLAVAVPDVLLALVVLTVTGTGTAGSVLAIGLAAAPAFARQVRAVVRTASVAGHVEADRALGARPLWIIRHTLLPAVAGDIAVYATSYFAVAVGLTAGLGFLGLGPPPPAAGWGSELAAGVAHLQVAPWAAAAPGLAIVVTTGAAVLLGDGLRDALSRR